MQIKIDVDDDTAEQLQQLSQLTGLTLGELIARQQSAHHAEAPEALALVREHPELSEQVANLFQSYGPESLLDGIRQIAPAGYLTLAEQFEREVYDAVGQQ